MDEITEKIYNKVKDTFNYTFTKKKNMKLMVRAFTCNQYASIHKTKDNTALATMGDSLLSYALTTNKYEMEKCNSTMETLTNEKNHYQDNTILNAKTKPLFEGYLLVENNDLTKDKVYADAFEALLYAIYVDSKSMDAIKTLVLRFVQNDNVLII
jgi:dsRNA-specific ribonuclease